MIEEAKGPMQQSSNELTLVLRQLDRLEDRTKDLATRVDLEALRKELVARESLEPQLNALRGQITRLNDDRVADRAAVEKRIDDVEAEQISRQDRLWIRISQAIAIAGFALALFDFLLRIKFTP